METTPDLLLERLKAIFMAVSIGSAIALVVWRSGFFSLPPNRTLVKGKLNWWQVVEIFAIFLIIEIFLGPSLYGVWTSMNETLSPEAEAIAKGWVNFISFVCTALGISVYLLNQNKELVHNVLGFRGYGIGWGENIKNFLKGAASWIVIYPWIVALGQIIAIIISYVYPGPEIDQLAVKHLKDIAPDPVLFGATAVAIVTVIPFLEELLFRGFLQTYFKGVFGRGIAICMTAFIFALFHFSTSQGIENIVLISSLFVLACFMGFMKEKMESLWASVGLHSTFNLVSVSMLLSS